MLKLNSTFRTKEPISISKWHSIRITRNKTKGSLQLDDGLVEYGEAQVISFIFESYIDIFFLKKTIHF
jgi:laminin G domain